MPTSISIPMFIQDIYIYTYTYIYISHFCRLLIFPLNQICYLNPIIHPIIFSALGWRIDETKRPDCDPPDDSCFPPNGVATLRGSYGKGLGQVFNWRGIIRVRPTPCKFPHKMAFVKCPCAFGLRRLAQNSGPEISVRQFPCKFPDKIALVKCPCAFPLRRLPQNAGPGIRVRPFPCKFPDKMALVKCPCAFANRALIEILYRDLARRPLLEILYRELVKRAGAFEVLYRDIA